MIFFTKYANDKFEILKRHGVVVGKKEVEEAVKMPDAIDESKAPLIFARKKRDLSAEGGSNYALKVAFKKEANIIKIITFYPVYEKEK